MTDTNPEHGQKDSDHRLTEYESSTIGPSSQNVRFC